eukprot:3183216-Rhodomonas_salina.2
MASLALLALILTSPCCSLYPTCHELQSRERRVFGHPQKEWADPLPAMRDLDLGSNKRILLAVGPEAGWQVRWVVLGLAGE